MNVGMATDKRTGRGRMTVIKPLQSTACYIATSILTYSALILAYININIYFIFLKAFIGGYVKHNYDKA